jgi:lipopolysaccharide/colanic/teichoic acid biosynthesis glycosyltransferase
MPFILVDRSFEPHNLNRRMNASKITTPMAAPLTALVPFLDRFETSIASIVAAVVAAVWLAVITGVVWSYTTGMGWYQQSRREAIDTEVIRRLPALDGGR